MFFRPISAYAWRLIKKLFTFERTTQVRCIQLDALIFVTHNGRTLCKNAYMHAPPTSLTINSFYFTLHAYLVLGINTDSFVLFSPSFFWISCSFSNPYRSRPLFSSFFITPICPLKSTIHTPSDPFMPL